MPYDVDLKHLLSQKQPSFPSSQRITNDFKMPKSFDKRNTDGTYETIFDYLKNLKNLTLAGVEYGKDFHHDHNVPFDGYTFITTNDKDSPVEFQTIVFGEIMPERFGTHINARGNHNALKPVSILKLSSVVRFY